MTEIDPSERAGGERAAGPAEHGAENPGLEAEGAGRRNGIGRPPRSTSKLVIGGLVVLGSVSIGASWYVPAERPLLIVVGTIGLFGGFLAYYLRDERFISAEVAERVYSAMAENENGFVDGLDHSSETIYVPTPNTVVLYVPADPGDRIPPLEDITVPYLSPDTMGGLTFVPTGAALLSEFEASLLEPLSSDPETLALQVNEGLVESFELAWETDLDLDRHDGRLDVHVTEPVFPIGFDTPTASFIAVGLASGLRTPVRTEVVSRGENGYVVTFHWNPDDTAGQA